MVLRRILIISTEVERVLSGVDELVLHFSYLYITSMEGMVITAFEEFPECPILFIQFSDLIDEVIILGYYRSFVWVMWDDLERFLCYPKELVLLFIILILFILIFFIFGLFTILYLVIVIREICYITEYLFTK